MTRIHGVPRVGGRWSVRVPAGPQPDRRRDLTCRPAKPSGHSGPATRQQTPACSRKRQIARFLQLPCGRCQRNYQRVQIDPSVAGFARVLAGRHSCRTAVPVHLCLAFPSRFVTRGGLSAAFACGTCGQTAAGRRRWEVPGRSIRQSRLRTTLSGAAQTAISAVRSSSISVRGHC